MKDRGLKKWNGFFIPQHISMLKKFEIEDMNVQKPVLDEDELYQINDVLVESVMDREQIQLKLWLDGVIEEFGPFIATKIEPHQRKLYGLYEDDICSYSFDNIIGAKRL
ncbi:YolD-like family protein [Heyndrickxia ginsengihumi]|uniref:YolD-like family protein n=1 Tax=Heyndrickxia ginsengihumi TaxID=363870 RepID=UPI003D234A5C